MAVTAAPEDEIFGLSRERAISRQFQRNARCVTMHLSCNTLEWHHERSNLYLSGR